MIADICPTMAPTTSNYQAAKLCLGAYVPIDRDILHIVLGALILGVCLMFRRRAGTHLAVNAAFALALFAAVGMEALDRIDDISTLGRWRWDASAWDVLRTIAVPALGVLAATFWRRTP